MRLNSFNLFHKTIMGGVIIVFALVLGAILFGVTRNGCDPSAFCSLQCMQTLNPNDCYTMCKQTYGF